MTMGKYASSQKIDPESLNLLGFSKIRIPEEIGLNSALFMGIKGIYGNMGLKRDFYKVFFTN
jgi:hypothetical protein